MPVYIFHLNRILMLMTKNDLKQLLFHMWKIRAEGYSTLKKYLYYSRKRPISLSHNSSETIQSRKYLLYDV